MATIRQITSQDALLFPEILELLNRTQGRDLFDLEYVQTRAADPLSYVLAAFEGSLIVSVGIAQVLPANGYDYYLPFDSQITKIFETHKVGSFATLCTHEDFQGKGIGKQISEMRLDWLKKQKCQVIVGVSWVSGLTHTSDRVFEKMGFQAVTRVENFYKSWSELKPFICPGCGKPPCTCAAILYRMNIKS